MRLSIKQNATQRFNTYKQAPRYIDIKTYFKKYLQSYLNWLYIQNNNFLNTLKTEEIVNYFFHEIKHPLWFQLYLKVMTFELITETTNYIEKYKKNADKMEVELPIILKKNIPGIEIVKPSDILILANKDEVDSKLDVIKKFRLEMTEEITDADIIIMDNILVALEKEKL